MKIGLLSTYLPEKCGVAIYTENLLKSFKNIKIIKIGTGDADYKLNLKSFNLKNKLKKIIKKEDITLLHIQHNYPHFSSILNLNLINALKLIPTIITLHEVQYPQKLSLIKKIRFNFIKLIEKQLVKKATKIIVHTPNQKQFLETEYKTKNIECIYHGLELLEENKRKGKNILSFGIITPAKGIHYLIKAMAYLKDCNLTIAGNTPKGLEKYKIELGNLIEDKKLDNVKTDFRWISEKEKWDYFKKSDIVILPYTWAPYQSGILHNALSYAIPVVVTKVGALWEIVDEFKLGEIVKPKDPKAIAEAIRKVSDNYQKYKKGIKEYRKAANWDAVAKEHIKLYRKIIS